MITDVEDVVKKVVDDANSGTEPANVGIEKDDQNIHMFGGIDGGADPASDFEAVLMPGPQLVNATNNEKAENNRSKVTKQNLIDKGELDLDSHTNVSSVLMPGPEIVIDNETLLNETSDKSVPHTINDGELESLDSYLSSTTTETWKDSFDWKDGYTDKEISETSSGSTAENNKQVNDHSTGTGGTVFDGKGMMTGNEEWFKSDYSDDKDTESSETKDFVEYPAFTTPSLMEGSSTTPWWEETYDYEDDNSYSDEDSSEDNDDNYKYDDGAEDYDESYNYDDDETYDYDNYNTGIADEDGKGDSLEETGNENYDFYTFYQIGEFDYEKDDGSEETSNKKPSESNSEYASDTEKNGDYDYRQTTTGYMDTAVPGSDGASDSDKGWDDSGESMFGETDAAKPSQAYGNYYGQKSDDHEAYYNSYDSYDQKAMDYPDDLAKEPWKDYYDDMTQSESEKDNFDGM